MVSPAAPAFLLDHMVIRLGKYLRIVGYDAVWDLTVRTHDLIRRANDEGRVFVTRNARLPYQYPQPDRLIRVVSTDPVEQFRQVVAEARLDPLSRLFVRCIRCNVDLAPVTDAGALPGRVHPNVLARHNRFTVCPACGTIFWFGSHVANTCRKLGLPAPSPGHCGNRGNAPP